MAVKAASILVHILVAPSGGQGPSYPCENPTCDLPPCKALLTGDVGCTTVSGTETFGHELLDPGATIAANAHIFGPFEAGFSSKQSSTIQGWGCSDPSVVYDEHGGQDLAIAEAHVAYVCDIELPRIEENTYYGIVGECGGHTDDYHFHVRFKCLYPEVGKHSRKIGNVASHGLYGKWEDYSQSKLPLLDACGAHFGFTPDSRRSKVYHYHVQDRPPFAVGCHGPSAQGRLVTVSECRSLYEECGDGFENITTKEGNVLYDRFCPCWDAQGSNVGTVELPAISANRNWYFAQTSPEPESAAQLASPTILP